MKPYYQDDYCTIYNADCREVLPELDKVDLVLTDPPYPDWMAEEYHFNENTIINALGFCNAFICFWSAKVDFIAPFDRVHIWDKKVGCGSQYERIYESGVGDNNWCVYNHYLVNSSVAASYSGDVFNEHKAQKPIKLVEELIGRTDSQTILDPFMGSGTTLVAAKQLGRKCIGIEMEEKYCEIAVKRLRQEYFDFGV